MAVVQRFCVVCQHPMLTYNARKIYCSDRCRKKAKQQEAIQASTQNIN